MVNWKQSAAFNGNFEGEEHSLDNSPAVDKGGGLVGIPCTAHGYSSGDTVRIYNTTNYNGTHVLDAATSADEMTQQSDAVTGSTEEMSANINAVATAIEQMSGNVQSVSSTAEQMSHNVKSVASAMEEMSVGLNEVAVVI